MKKRKKTKTNKAFEKWRVIAEGLQAYVSVKATLHDADGFKQHH